MSKPDTPVQRVLTCVLDVCFSCISLMDVNGISSLEVEILHDYSAVVIVVS